MHLRSAFFQPSVESEVPVRFFRWKEQARDIAHAEQDEMTVNSEHVLVVSEIESAQFQVKLESEDVVRILGKQCVGRKEDACDDANV